MDLSIITVTYNSRGHIADQIRSVNMAAEGFDWEEIVIDNASSDGTADFYCEEFSESDSFATKRISVLPCRTIRGRSRQGKYLLF